MEEFERATLAFYHKNLERNRFCEFDVYWSILLRISSVCSDSGQEVKNFHPNVQLAVMDS